MALIRLTFLLLLATFISGNALAASRGIANPALFPNRVVAQEESIDLLTGLVYSGNYDAGGWDCSGNDNHLATNGNPALVTGLITNGFLLAGENANYFVITNSPVSATTSASLSVSMWVKVGESNLLDYAELFALATTDCDEAPYVRFVRNWQAGGGGEGPFVEAMILNTSPAYVAAESPFEDWVEDEWYHMAFTWDHTTSNLQVWVNGVPGDTAFVEFPRDDTGLAMFVGGSCVNVFNTSYSELDEVKVWSRVLSTNEIAYLFENPEEASIACAVPSDGIALVDSTTHSFGATTSTSVGVPAGIQAGDLLVFLLCTDSDHSFTDLAGFTEREHSTLGASGFTAATKVATGSEGSSIAFGFGASENGVAVMIAYRNAAFDADNIGSGTTPHTTPGVLPSADNGVVLGCVFIDPADSVVFTEVTPVVETVVRSASAALGVAHKFQTTATSEGVSIDTDIGSTFGRYTMSLIPD